MNSVVNHLTLALRKAISKYYDVRVLLWASVGVSGVGGGKVEELPVCGESKVGVALVM